MLVVNNLFSSIKEARDAINRHVLTRESPTECINQTVAVVSLYAKILSANSGSELLCLRKMGLLLQSLFLILVVLPVTIRTSNPLLCGSF
jgi:hypothetical protein